jgi:hypothetical protein
MFVRGYRFSGGCEYVNDDTASSLEAISIWRCE